MKHYSLHDVKVKISAWAGKVIAAILVYAEGLATQKW